MLVPACGRDTTRRRREPLMWVVQQPYGAASPFVANGDGLGGDARRGPTAQPPLAVVAPDAGFDAEDERLMDLIRSGDPAGLEGLYDRNHRAAMALAVRMLGDRSSAEDVIQEAFLAVWRRA